MKKLYFILLGLLSFSSFSQDSLRVMYHNVLNFPGTTPDRADSLRNILSYVQTDVYVVCELETEAGADLILNNALNVYGITKYKRANFEDGLYTDNMLFYNSEKLGLLSQTQIGTVQRDISEYVLYYKSPNLSSITDTIYFHFFACHLKAGSSHYQQRNTEIQQVKFYLNAISNTVENVFIGGDMNVYSGFESAVLTLKNTGDVPMFDPINVDGNWSNDVAYADFHTQSTRSTTAYAGGSGGGLDDRFDLVFVSEDVLNNTNGVHYLSNSYKALGQDGNRFNQTILYPPNSSLPDSVVNALYRVSDHLPVMMTVVLDETAASPRPKQETIEVIYDRSNKRLKVSNEDSFLHFRLYDVKGLDTFEYKGFSGEINLSHLSSGIYLYKVKIGDKFYSDKLLID